jgi:hypothetical protein
MGRKSNPEQHYNREVNRLKLKVRKAYNRRKLGKQYRGELKRLSKQLLLVILKSILKHEGKCWTEFYSYVLVKRREGNMENIAVIKHGNGCLITERTN